MQSINRSKKVDVKIPNSSGHGYNDPVMDKLDELYHSLLNHDGFGELRMDLRILKRGQKEVIIHCGKQYRFVVDDPVNLTVNCGCVEHDIQHPKRKEVERQEMNS
jgi:hypothetical protein